MLTDIQRKIVQRAIELGVPPEVALGQAEQESSFDPAATGKAGEYGLFQIHPKTAPEVGLTPQNAYDVDRNIDAGVGYFARMMDLTGGDITKALQAYNGGYGHVQDGTVSRAARGYSQSVQDRARKFLPEVYGASPGYGENMDDPAAMYGGGSSMTGDPTADAMAMLPQVSRSAVDQNVIRSTMGVADKLINGQVTGSLTSPQDRMENSTGSLAAEMIPTWQTAQKLLNPVNLLQLPMRALKMVDYTLRQAAGAPTLTDAAEAALAYTNAGEFISRDPEATARDARQQELTTAKGLRGQILTPTQKLVHIFTTDPFEGERRAITSSRAMQAGLTAQMDLDKAFKGRVERDQKAAEAPYEVAMKRAQAQKATAEAPFAARMAEAQVRNMEALPEYRQQSLFAQRLAARRSMLTQPDERGYSPLDRYRMNRDTADDVRRAEAEARAREEAAAKNAEDARHRSFMEENTLVDNDSKALAKAQAARDKNRSLDDINALLAGSRWEAYSETVPGYFMNGTEIRFRRRAGAAAPAAPKGQDLSGLSSHNSTGGMDHPKDKEGFIAWAKKRGMTGPEALQMWKQIQEGTNGR